MTIQPDDLVALFGGIGGTAGVMQLLRWRSDRRLARAQAVDTEASAQQRILAAGATLIEQTGTILPQLNQQVAELRAELNVQGAELDRVRADRDADRAELAAVRGWLQDHQRWDLAALAAIRELGGHLDPPSPPPARQPAGATQ